MHHGVDAAGVQVHITEMDVALAVGPDGRPLDVSDLTRQAEVYRVVVEACLRQPGCTAFQTWGLTDKDSWIPRFWEGMGAALLFDVDFNPKPAYSALIGAFDRTALR